MIKLVRKYQQKNTKTTPKTGIYFCCWGGGWYLGNSFQTVESSISTSGFEISHVCPDYIA